MKPTLPFGQLPYIEHGDVKLAQSGAIMRYIGHLGGLNGDDAKSYALSEMLLAEAEDIFVTLARAKNSGDCKNQMDAAFAVDGSVHKQLQYLEKLIPDGETYFLPGPKRSTGGYYVACVLDVINNLEPTCLDAFPKLKTFFTAMFNSSAFEGLRELPMYITRE